eukprot:EC720699.1.p3 GENE.EC720699.1~~EC720699.1.p3  ORF type:complete len:50 (+),score=4.05 EC720699.1:18-167(+)
MLRTVTLLFRRSTLQQTYTRRLMGNQGSQPHQVDNAAQHSSSWRSRCTN